MSKVKGITIFLFLSILLFWIKPVSAADNVAHFNPTTGNIEFSTTGKLAPSSSWRYKTVGFIVSKKPVPNFAPLESPPCTEYLPLIGKYQVDQGNGYATSYFEIPVSTVQSALAKAGMNDLVSGESTVYLHAVFSTIKPGKTEVTDQYYTSYNSGPSGIMNATDNSGQIIKWSATTSELLKASYNISAKYYAKLPPNPSGIGEVDGNAEVDGAASWSLLKNDPNKGSTLQIQNALMPVGTYYAMRNPEYTILIDGKTYQTSQLSLSPQLMNEKKVTFQICYEYTNHYYDTFEPDLIVDGSVVRWKFVKRDPVWDYSKTYVFSKDLFISTRYGEQIHISNDNSSLELQVGESYNVKSDINNPIFERFFFHNLSTIQLPTQHSIDINNKKILYNNDLGSKLTVIGGPKYFLPPDIEENLKDEYLNAIYPELGKYSIPIELTLSDLDTNYSSADLTFEDDFYLTKQTGFLFSVKDGLTKDEIVHTAKTEYEKYTGKEYDSENDSIITNLNENKTRYYLPISSHSDLKPGIQYENKYVLGKLGLSDITIRYSVTFTFDKYLFGSVFDNVYVNEEPAPLASIDYPFSITLTNAKMKDFKNIIKSNRSYMHGFITSDSIDIARKLKPFIKRNDVNI